ncbi:hypothetical protein ACFTTN_30755 [Streptomyces niveus]|uniref:hypothetical protein n=1 Tax=Streptomyces niveus TaxID=193462 RepID=UPI003643DE1E
MRQAIAEAVDASTRQGTFILWRTCELLRQMPEGRAVKLPSERTLYLLLAKLTDGTHTFGSAVTRRSHAHGAVGPFKVPSRVAAFGLVGGCRGGVDH